MLGRRRAWREGRRRFFACREKRFAFEQWDAWGFGHLRTPDKTEYRKATGVLIVLEASPSDDRMRSIAKRQPGLRTPNIRAGSGAAAKKEARRGIAPLVKCWTNV